MLYTHLIRIVNNNNNNRPRVLVLPYGTGNKVSRNDGLMRGVRGIYRPVHDRPTVRGVRPTET